MRVECDTQDRQTYLVGLQAKQKISAVKVVRHSEVQYYTSEQFLHGIL